MDTAIFDRSAKPRHRHVSAKAVSPADEELLARIQQGDEAAFNVLYVRYFKRVYGFVYRRLNDRADVEETTQEIFINLFSGIDSYRGEGT
ncbi:MAG: sigma factor, partial [Myxococcota bacterium]